MQCLYRIRVISFRNYILLYLIMIRSIESSNTYRNVILQFAGTYYYNEIIFCSCKGGYFCFLYSPGLHLCAF